MEQSLGPGYKYHIVTVVSFFFALTIGLVVGSLFVSPRLVDRQTRAIEGLQKTVNSENDSLQQKVHRWDKYSETINPTLLRGRLPNAAVAIVTVGDYPETEAKVRETLELAGAHVVSTTVLKSALMEDDGKLADVLRSESSTDPRFPSNREELIKLLSNLIASDSSQTQPSSSGPNVVVPPLAPAYDEELIRTLDRRNLFRFQQEGDTYTPARYVVLLTGSKNDSTVRISTIDSALIHALTRKSILVVACEPTEAEYSDVPVYRKLNLDMATVDDIDTDFGRCALVFALRGYKDHYGMKPTAASLLPPLNLREK